MSLAAFLFIGPQSEFTNPDPSQVVGTQRLFTADPVPHFPEFTKSNLATDISMAVFAITGDDDICENVYQMVCMRLNVWMPIGNGMAVAVYPAHPGGWNAHNAEPIHFLLDTHRED